MHSTSQRWIAMHSMCALALYALAACTPASTSSPAPSPTAQPAHQPTDSSAGKPQFVSALFAPGELQYDLQFHSNIQLTGDSLLRRDSTQISSRIAVTFNTLYNRDQVAAIVRIDSTILRSSNSITPVSLPSSVFSFTVDRGTGRVVPDEPQSSPSCSEGVIAMPFYGTEVVPTVHPRMPERWSDTTRLQTCRGAILLTLTRIATYSTAGKSSMDPTQLLRTSQVVVSGSGYQWSQKVDISGDGIGTDTLSFNAAGRLERISGTSSLTLMFRSPFRTQQFTQMVTSTVSSRK